MANDPIKDVTWRSQVESSLHDLRDDLERARAAGIDAAVGANDAIAERSIARAHEAAASAPRRFSGTWFRRWASGSDVETAWTALHDAEQALVLILPNATVHARLPDIRAGLTTTLAGDGRVEEYARALSLLEGRKPQDITQADREQIRVIKSAIDSTSDAAHSNIRNYRNWLLIVSAVVIVGLLGAAIAHARNSEFIYIGEAGSPGHAGADVAELEAAGGLGGLLMAIFALIRLTVYSGPVALPLWQALVRVPAGAVAGLVGAALLQGKLLSSFVPQQRSGLLAYAFLFGAAPEIVLRLLDNKVNAATAAARPKNDPLKTVPHQARAGAGGNQASGNEASGKEAGGSAG
jgi:hypothetical protein